MAKTTNYFSAGKDHLLAKLLSNDSETTTANFQLSSLLAEDKVKLGDIIKTNTYLKRLNLIDSNLQASDFQLIAQALESNTTILEINIERFLDDSDETKRLIDQIDGYINRNNKLFAEQDARDACSP